MTTEPIPFLGLQFTPASCEEALALVAAQVDARAPFVYVVTPNVDHVVALSHDVERRAPLYGDAWLTLNDSRILELLAKWSKIDLPACAGADITAVLFEKTIDPQEPITIIGGTEAVIEGLQARFGLTQLHWHESVMGLADNPAARARAAAFIAAHASRFVFLAVGAPQQEMVAKAALDRGDCTGVGLCVGASLEFLSGVRKRAPLWMRNARLEWAFRLGQEPGRMWRRHLVEGPAIFALWLKWRGAQRAASRAAMAARSSD